MTHAMAYTVIALEVPASCRGAVSVECPREVYTKLSWSEWSASLPNEWTLFLPLNSRYIPIHDRQEQANNDIVEEDSDEDAPRNPGQIEDTDIGRRRIGAILTRRPGTLTVPQGDSTAEPREI